MINSIMKGFLSSKLLIKLTKPVIHLICETFSVFYSVLSLAEVCHYHTVLDLSCNSTIINGCHFEFVKHDIRLEPFPVTSPVTLRLWWALVACTKM